MNGSPPPPRSRWRAGHLLTARADYLRASACFRVGQVPLPDTDARKKAMYHRLIEYYGAAGAARPIRPSSTSGSRTGTPRSAGGCCAPPGCDRPPTVIVMGGFDGWREEYHVGATYLLARGIAVLLVDGPGQGETRVLQGLHMTSDVEKAFSAMVDHLLRRRPLRRPGRDLGQQHGRVPRRAGRQPPTTGSRRAASTVAPCDRRRYSTATTASSPRSRHCWASRTPTRPAR